MGLKRQPIVIIIFCYLNLQRWVKVERIVSLGHSSPDNEWYDQEENEWVILVKGSAGLLFEGNEEVNVLESGDYINIPSHTRHRVEWTDPDTETVWLVIHYKGEG